MQHLVKKSIYGDSEDRWKNNNTTNKNVLYEQKNRSNPCFAFSKRNCTFLI